MAGMPEPYVRRSTQGGRVHAVLGHLARLGIVALCATLIAQRQTQQWPSPGFTEARVPAVVCAVAYSVKHVAHSHANSGWLYYNWATD